MRRAPSIPISSLFFVGEIGIRDLFLERMAGRTEQALFNISHPISPLRSTDDYDWSNIKRQTSNPKSQITSLVINHNVMGVSSIMLAAAWSMKVELRA